MSPQKLQQKDSQVNFIPRKGSDYEDDEIRVAGMGKFDKARYKLTVKRIVLLVIVFLTIVLMVGLISALISKRRNPCLNGKQLKTVGNTDSPDTRSTLSNVTESTAITGNDIWHQFRLPKSHKPSHYEIQIKTDIEKQIFAGQVSIYFDCVETTEYILLHVLGLNISRDSLVLSSVDNTVNVPPFKDEPFIYEPNQFYVITLQDKLPKKHAYVLRMRYSGAFSNDMAGLYLTGSKIHDGSIRYSVASFLSPTQARRVWPCFDEPSLKANFSVSIIHKPNYTALSNMPSIGDPVVKLDGWWMTRFETTPRMSTYLVAFIVCDYSHKITMLRDNLEFRVWARTEAFADVEYALEFGPKVVRFLEEYLDIPYPLPKLDMVALPDFAAGAMENWGLLTFREPNMLYNAQQNPSYRLQMVSLVIAHELGHQWFSNLVTQEFWDELWLKECFANVLAFLAMDYINPDWHMWDEQFVVSVVFKVFKLDALPTSAPIQKKVTSTSEILDSFDAIAYWKSEAVVRMMEFTLGRTVFKKGLRVFLQNRAYSNARAPDLWNAISEVAVENGLDIDLNHFMNPWILQRGYPLITITRDYESSAVEVSQQLFLYDPNAKERIVGSPYGYEWITPITYTYNDGPTFTSPNITWLKKTEDRLLISEVTSEKWIIANINRTGYFRTNYDDRNWRLLQAQLNTNHEKISPSTRAALTGDAFSLALAGKVNISLAMNLTEYMIYEKDFVPWRVVGEYLGYISRMLRYTPAYGNLKKYVLKQVSALYEEVGWNDTGSHLYRQLRQEILKIACGYGHEDCQKKAAEQFKLFYTKGTPVPPNFRPFVYASGIGSSTGTERDFGWEQYKNSNSTSESQLWLQALSATTEPWLLSRYLERALDPDYVRQTDTVEVFKYLSDGNPVGGYSAWNVFRSNWELLRKRYAGGLFLMNDIIEAVTIWFNTPFLLQELETFIASIETDMESQAGLSSLYQAVDNTKANIRWMDMNYNEVRQWLANNAENYI